MKILCLNPPFKTEFGRYSRDSRSPAIPKGGTIYYPIWLSYATAVLEKNGHNVKLVDSCAYNYNKEVTLKNVKEFEPELVIVNTSTPSIYNDVAIGAEIKKLLSNTFVVLVGTHPTALPEETLKLNKYIDAIARREYDYTLKELAQTLSNDTITKKNREKVLSKIKGLSFRDNERIIHNKDRDFIIDLDKLPYVSEIYKKHLDVKKYFTPICEHPMVMIWGGRGCPGRCSFCVYPQVFHGHIYRKRSAENLVGEFEYIIKELPQVRTVGIEDDTLTFNKKRLWKFCNLLIEKKINKKLIWWANVRVNTVDLESVQLMKKAGCRLLIPGFESGSQKILDNVNKRIRLSDSIEFMNISRKVGVEVHGCFMVGNPGETKETMNETLKFAMKLNPDSVQFFPLIVYPGTKLYLWAKKNKYLHTNNYSEWLTTEGLHNCVIDLENLSSVQLTEFCNLARRKYYLRPKYIFKKIKQNILHPKEITNTIKSGKIFMKYLFKK